MPTPLPLTIIADGVLVFHVAAGFLSLIAGGAIMLMRKGDGRHRRLGRGFTLAMLAIAVSALALTLVRPDNFLLTIALFSAYLALTGWWAIAGRHDRRPIGGRWFWVWGLPAAGMATALAMLTVAGAEALAGGGDRPIILIVFGLGLAAMAARDLLTARGGLVGQARTARHIQRMMGAWIASLTAFAVVNLSFLPDLAVWLGPTALVSPLIGYWSRRYAPKVRAVIA